MSSSKIIKSIQNDADALPGFNFGPIGQSLVSAPPDGAAGFVLNERPDNLSGFIPLELFGGAPDICSESTELELPEEELPEEELPEEPEGIMLTEEELDHRLRESFESGLQDGKNLAERGLLNVFTSLRMATEGLHVLREKIIRESEDELVKLIMMIARKVILREVALDRHILSDVVQKAIESLSERDEIIIHLNPDDYNNVTANREDIFRKELVTNRMQFRSDPAVHLGSCRVDTEMGTIDASFDSQLDEIFRRMQEERIMSSGAGA